jgi:tetratricopeptide (TPR) repeat protein
LELAVDDCSQAVQRKADCLDAFYLRGTALKELGQIERAMEDLNVVLQGEPTYHEAHYARGSLFYLQGRWEEAIDDFSEFLKRAPATSCLVVDCYRLRGIAAHELGRNRAALEDLTLAIEADPTNATTYLRRSQVYDALGESDRAAADFKKATGLRLIS